MGVLVRLAELPIDQPLSDTLYTSDGTVILQRGDSVTSELLQQLAERGLRFLELGLPGCSPPACPPNGDVRKAQVRLTRAATDAASAVSESAGEFPALVIRAYDPARSQRLDELVRRTAEAVNSLGLAMAEQSRCDADLIHQAAGGFLRELRGDQDQVVAESLGQDGDRDLAIRSVQLSVLAMAICRAMQLPDAEGLIAGTAAMLHDVALFRLPPEQRMAHRDMPPESRLVYEWHPVIAFDLLERVREVNGVARHIVLQVHEQPDGSGYPRQLRGSRIHRLARVLNAADAYLRLTSYPPEGQGIYPADAIAYLMYHACAGRFDTAATYGLIQVISLYPLGTTVLLTDDSRARVIRCNPSSPLAPVVVPAGSDVPVDLSQGGDLRVREPLSGGGTRRRLAAKDLDLILL